MTCLPASSLVCRVEVWDGQAWSFMGAAEYDPQGFNRQGVGQAGLLRTCSVLCAAHGSCSTVTSEDSEDVETVHTCHVILKRKTSPASTTLISLQDLVLPAAR